LLANTTVWSGSINPEPNDVTAFLSENAEGWEQAASFLEQMSSTPTEVSVGNEFVLRLHGAIYRERSNISKPPLAELKIYNAVQREQTNLVS
jgi:hypothetical protein